MAVSDFSPDRRRRVDRVLRDLAPYAFDLIVGGGAVQDGMRDETARELFPPILGAAVELQAKGVEPTDAELHAHGAPPPHKTKRFWDLVDVAPLPLTLARAAIDAGVVPAPKCIVVESRTEVATGPDKIGVAHLQKPPGIDGGPKASLHTRGGIASAMGFCDCGDIILPCGGFPLHQHWWHPSSYSSAKRALIEQELRRRARYFDGPFVHDPDEVVEHLLDGFAAVDRLADWRVRLGEAVISGGRLRMGFPPAGEAEFGTGREDRYLGASLRAVCRIRSRGYEAFLELPQALRAARRAGVESSDSCGWRFLVGGEWLALRHVEARCFDESSPWTVADHALVARDAGEGVRILTLATSAKTPDTPSMDVTLVLVIDGTTITGATKLFVTTLDPSREGTTARIVRLAAQETGQRRSDSPMEVGIRSLHIDGFVQRNQRRRHPDRRSVSAIAQAAFAVLELSRSQAA